LASGKKEKNRRGREELHLGKKTHTRGGPIDRGRKEPCIPKQKRIVEVPFPLLKEEGGAVLTV